VGWKNPPNRVGRDDFVGFYRSPEKPNHTP
jgi:hypothetical protein